MLYGTDTPTVQELIDRTALARESLLGIGGGPDVMRQQAVLLDMAERILNTLYNTDPGNIDQLVASARDVTTLETQTATLVSQAETVSLYRPTVATKSYALWWALGGIAAVGVAAYVISRLSRGRNRRHGGLGSLHATKAGGGGDIPGAVAAL